MKIETFKGRVYRRVLEATKDEIMAEMEVEAINPDELDETDMADPEGYADECMSYYGD